MPRKHRFESGALQFLYDRYVGTDPAKQAAYEAELARAIYEMRTKAGLSQRELAEMLQTTASVISRLEDARYDGHSLAMLRRVAAAFDKRVEIRFVSRMKGAARGVAERARPSRRVAGQGARQGKTG
jgi:transcriptional regulator with XRE-family HTH domain